MDSLPLLWPTYPVRLFGIRLQIKEIAPVGSAPTILPYPSPNYTSRARREARVGWSTIMGGSPHLSERQHVQHAPFPSSHLNSQSPVSATHGNGLVDSRQSPDPDRHASRRPAPAAQSTSSHSRLETGPSDLTYKLDSQPGSPGSAGYIGSQAQTQELSGSSNNSTGQIINSPKRLQPLPRPIEPPIIDSQQDKVNTNPQEQVGEPSTIPKSSPTMLVSQKRTATGMGKSAHSPQDLYRTGQAGSGRRRSGSIGSLSHGNRIAAVSIIVCFLVRSISNTNPKIVVRSSPHPPILCCLQDREKPPSEQCSFTNGATRK